MAMDRLEGWWNIMKLTREVIQDRETAVAWCQDVGLLPRSSKCTLHGTEMQLALGSHGLGIFRCRKKPHDICKSMAENTWFSHSSLPLETAIVLTYCFANDFSYEEARRESRSTEAQLSDSTIANWYSYGREVCMVALDRRYDNSGLLGGFGKVVQVDETKIGKRKYNTSGMVEGSWVLGMIDEDGDLRLEILPDNSRSAETLLSLVEKHVEKGTTIVTDCWKGYEGLTEAGFQHLTVDRSYNFVDPGTGAHTQRIRSSWGALKRSLCRGKSLSKEHLADHFCEYLWRRSVKKRKQDLFAAFVKEIRTLYTPPT